MALKIIKPGVYAAVQDMGRTSHRRYGVPMSGCMDRHAAAVANLLVGNPVGAAVIEFLMHGAVLEATEEMLVAFSGGGAIPQVDGVEVPLERVVRLPKNSVIRMSYTDKGCRIYMSAAGGIDVPLVMGSRSSYEPVGAGYRLLSGREVRTGDMDDISLRILDSLCASGRTVAPWGPVEWLEQERSEWVRVLRGPEWAQLPYREAMSATYIVSDRSDRMGMLLENSQKRAGSREQKVESREQKAGITAQEMLSTGVTIGTIQLLPSGLPMVLMADAQTTGGYARLAQVIDADLWILAQARPGDKVKFREVSLPVAQELYRNRKEELQRLARSIKTRFA